MAKARQDGGSSNNVCSYNQDEFHCARADDNCHAFVRWETADRLYREFCNSVSAPSGEANWRVARRYNEGTPEAVEFVILLSNGAFEFNRGQCLESMDRIINSCDGNDPNNPLNLKFGGRYKRGNFQYEVNPLMENRAMFTEAGGRCWGDYRFFYSHFDVEGRGWLGDDFGEAFRGAVKSCIGGGLTAWKFEYYDRPADHEGSWEWKASFNTPIWVSLRCFDNQKPRGVPAV